MLTALWLLLYVVPLLLLVLAIGMYVQYQKNVTLVAHIPGYNQFIFPNLMKLVPSFLKPLVKVIPSEFLGDAMLWNLKERYNSHIIKYATGPIVILFVTDPDFPKQFIALGTKVFAKDGFFVDYLNKRMGPNVFSLIDDDVWKRHRTLLNVAFTDKTYAYVCECTVDAMKQFDAMVQQKATRNAGDCMAAVTMDVIGKTGFGYNFENVINVENPSSAVRETKEFFGNLMKLEGLPSALFGMPFGNVGKLNRTVQFTMDLIADIIKKRKNTPADEKPRDILQLLLDSAEQESYSKMTQQEIMSNCFAVLIAAHDTTAWTLTFTLYLLATNPDVQLALQKKIDAVLPNKQDPSFADMDNLKFVENVFKEALRIYPVAPVVPRGIKQDFDFKGTKIPAGTFVFTCTGVMQRDPEHWEEPMTFKPERWEDPKVHAKLKENPFLYAPFGIGHRSCIGKRFAQIEGVMVLAMILQRYTVTLADANYKMTPLVTITTRPQEELFITFSNRK